tara:strand:- start:3770 stop:4351 length:582 start_codon:yes stop_codon:yes gene_type:complete
MPDLIIKPQTNSGDRLRLQDRTGTDVLTTADSGATIANATLTTPTIASMANCTFPAGHPVAETFFTQSSDRVYISASGSDTIISVACNFVSTSNKMLVLASIGGNVIGAGGELDLEIQDGSSTLRDFAQCMRWSSATSISTLRNRVQVSIVDYLTVPSTGSVTISIVGKPATQDFEFQDGSQISTLFVQEIKS